MPREVVIVCGRQITVSPNARPPLTSFLTELANGQVTDELTEKAPAAPTTVTTTLTGAVAACTVDGILTVAGVPIRTPILPFDLTLCADGYVPQTVATSLGPQAGMPATFQSVTLTPVALHRQPITIVGRVVSIQSQTTTPVNGAGIQVTALWRQMPQPGVPSNSEPGNIVAVQPPLGLARSVAADTMSQCSLTPTGMTKALLLQALAGDTQIVLSDALGLATGDLVEIDGADPDLAEVVTLTSAPAIPVANQPATLTLAAPLMVTHWPGAIAGQVTPQPPGPSSAFAQAALPGDPVVFLANLTGLAPQDTARIPGASDEYHTVRLFQTTSAPDGYYRLPPISRVYQIEITVDDGLGHTQVVKFWPDYSLPENQLDFVFS